MAKQPKRLHTEINHRIFFTLLPCIRIVRFHEFHVQRLIKLSKYKIW